MQALRRAGDDSNFHDVQYLTNRSGCTADATATDAPNARPRIDVDQATCCALTRSGRRGEASLVVIDRGLGGNTIHMLVGIGVAGRRVLVNRLGTNGTIDAGTEIRFRVPVRLTGREQPRYNTGQAQAIVIQSHRAAPLGTEALPAVPSYCPPRKNSASVGRLNLSVGISGRSVRGSTMRGVTIMSNSVRPVA